MKKKNRNEKENKNKIEFTIFNSDTSDNMSLFNFTEATTFVWKLIIFTSEHIKDPFFNLS